MRDFFSRFNFWRKKNLKFSDSSPSSLQKKFDKKLVNSLLPKKIPAWRQLKFIGKFFSPMEKRLATAFVIVILASLASLSAEIILRHRVVLPERGGEYIEGILGSPSAVNPLFSSLNPADADLSRLIYAGLLRYDSSLKLVPDLAEEYSLSDDGKIYTVTLKQNLKWQDGEQLTIDDVAFTLSMIQDPETRSPLLPAFQKVRFKKINDLSFTLELEQPFAPFAPLLTTGILPLHLWQEVPPANARLSPLNLKPVGSGSFMFNSLSKDGRGNIKSYSLKANPYYHFNQPYLEQITFKFFPDANSALDALRNRQVNGLSGLPKDQKEKISKNVNILSLRMPHYAALFLNQKNNLLLKNKTLRQALNLAIDRQVLISQALKGEGLPAFGPLPPGAPGFTKDFKTEQDIARAKKILDQDKWKTTTRDDFIVKRERELLNTWLEQQKAVNPLLKDKKKLTAEEQEMFNREKQNFIEKTAQEITDGLSPTQTSFREKNGYGLSVTLTALNQPEFFQAANLIKEWWEDLGAQVNLDLVEAGRVRETIKNRSYEVLLHGVVAGTDPDPFAVWHSTQIAPPGLNLSGFVSRGADDLLEKARAASDSVSRAKLYYDFQKILSDELPALFLYHSIYLYPIDRSINGVESYRINQPADRFNGVADWYINTKSGWR